MDDGLNRLVFAYFNPAIAAEWAPRILERLRQLPRDARRKGGQAPGVAGGGQLQLAAAAARQRQDPPDSCRRVPSSRSP